MSFVYGHDIVSRLSLGSVRDLTRGAAWLCAAENREGDKGEGYSSLTKKALKYKMGRGEEGDEEWVSPPFTNIRRIKYLIRSDLSLVHCSS